MKRSVFPIRIVGLVGMVALLALFLASPVGASWLLTQPEPTPRPTATPAPYLELEPTQGIAGTATPVTASGVNWQPNQDVILYWDIVDDAHRLTDPVNTRGNGTFETSFATPTSPALATVGMHVVIAVQGEFRAEATFQLIPPPPTFTPTRTNTPRPPTPTFTSTPITPSPTFTASPTVSPSPTLRPVTPQTTISPIPPTKAPAPIVTRRPTATRTRTPVPGTATNTPLPSLTPTPSQTPGPGTPSATPQPLAPQATATPVGEISETGGGWGTLILWGFVLAGLLVVFRMLRVRSIPR